MCNPLLYNCSAPHFPLLIDSAMERLHDALGGEEVHLSKEAQDVLYQHGNKHRKEFEKALQSQDQAKLDDLSNRLQERLKVALRGSEKADKGGVVYHPRRIDAQGMKKALKDEPWIP